MKARRERRPGAPGLGIDIVEVSRVRRLAARRPSFLSRFLTPAEEKYCSASANRYERIAARFAAKEAVIKALDDRSIPLRSIEVLKNVSGKPAVRVSAPGYSRVGIELSLTHTSTYACAAALVWRK
ncbi:MAG TPA: holo-ACP synthase [Elusimicrobiales bacterium]|nr:holo-ACP synthase [Elusimicrobiales bacterium]